MKRKTKAILFLALAIAILTAGCTIVVTPKTSEEWDLYYRWDNEYQYSTAVWRLYSDRTFEDNNGDHGQWSVNDSLFQLAYDNTTIIIYDNIIYEYSGTVYTGTIHNSSYIDGTMSGKDSQNNSHNGTWYAKRGNWNALEVEPSDVEHDKGIPFRTPSGRLIESQQSGETNP